MEKIRFGTDGWRGVIAEDFTFSNLRRVSTAVAAFLREKSLSRRGIVIGHDTRFLAERFAAVVAEEMQSQGINVFLNTEAAPTPVIAYGVKHKRAGGAVMLTASHNPPEYMGFKFIPEYAGPAMPYITDRITDYINQGDKPCAPGGKGAVKEINLRDSYLKFVAGQVDLDKIRRGEMRFVIDSMHGAGMGYLEDVLANAGSEIVALRNWRDPLFGGEMPEPKADLLGELVDRIKSGKGNMGLALDGDADRFGIVDGLGKYLTPNQVMALLFSYLVEVRNIRGPVAKTVATTTLLDRMAKAYGVDVIETPVGFKYQGQAMLKQGAILAGEESGGLSVQGHIPEKDGILACLLMAEVAAHHRRPLSLVMEEIYAKYGHLHTSRLDFRCAPGKKQSVLELLSTFEPSKIGELPVKKISRLDGWKYHLDGGNWLLVRASGTESVFRIYGEAEDMELLSRLQDALAGALGLLE